MGVPYQQPVIIPLVPSIPWYRITTQIADTPYIFDVRWNVRDAAWYFDLFEIDETPIASGIKIVLGVPLGRRIKHALMRCGAFVAKDISGKWKDAGLDDLGTRVQLRYYSALNIISAARRGVGMGQ